MIELIYNEEEVNTSDEAVLREPKNIRQIGKPKESKKIFIEDYVHTYLQQYSAGGELCFAVLLGTSKFLGGQRHFYIKGALPVKGITEKHGKYYFSELIWGRIYEECERYFPEQEIMGWFLSREGFTSENNRAVEETHRIYFAGADKFLLQMEPLEGKGFFYGFDGSSFVKQEGYYIYYEKNHSMREFMLEQNKQKEASDEKEIPERTVTQFRRILKEKEQKTVQRRKKTVSYGVKAVAAAALFAAAVIFRDQIDLLAPGREASEVTEREPVQEMISDGVVVEELSGDVAPQQEAAEEMETASEEAVLPVTEEEIPEEPEAEDDETGQEEEPAEEPAEEAAAPVHEEYVVQAGDTLAHISRKFYGTEQKVSEICALNEISDGDYIQVGEIILLP